MTFEQGLPRTHHRPTLLTRSQALRCEPAREYVVDDQERGRRVVEANMLLTAIGLPWMVMPEEAP